MTRWWTLLLLTACGRIGFDATDGGPGGDAASGGDSMMMVDGPPGSTTLTFGETPTAMIQSVTRDTYISNEAGEASFNYGADDEVRIERDVNERALLGFTVTAIPSTATVLSASLSVTVTEVPPSPSAIDVHRMLEAWDEGNASGSSGVANYITRLGASTWSSPGGGPPLSASASLGQLTPALGRKTIALPASLIQLWVVDAGENHGVIMISTNDDSTRFTTSKGIPLADRPVLTVTFIP